MQKESSAETTLLRWSKNVPSSDVQDPLGTSLRGSTRLASRLLHCITSITPRARYFSFIPWCVLDFQRRERGKPGATSLSQAISYREHALTLGCVVYHDGHPCVGGRLVGSDEAVKWYAKHQSGQADFRKLRFVKNAAYKAYFASLVNLGMFVADEELPESDEEDEEPRTFEDIELSPLGQEVARSYDSAVKELPAVRHVGAFERCCSLQSLRQFGEIGGLCEVKAKSASDRGILREIMFCCRSLKGDAHRVRRQSLLLMLELCRQLSLRGETLDHSTYADAVYFAEVAQESQQIKITLPQQLQDNALRWRMFYFHYYMAVALESLFSWLVTNLEGMGLAGLSLDEIVGRLSDKVVRTDIKEFLGVKLARAFSETTPGELLAHFGVCQGPLSSSLSVELDTQVSLSAAISEPALEAVLRNRTYQNSSTGLAAPMVLLAVTLGRYKRWESTNYGDWFASVAKDPYLDAIPPVLLNGLHLRLDDWWNRSFADLTEFVLSRYVVQLHQSLSYEKTWAGERCILHTDGTKIVAAGSYDRIVVENTRLGSALQVLQDLGLMTEDNETRMLYLTKDGQGFLREQLDKEEAE
jgi:hypothetical protein